MSFRAGSRSTLKCHSFIFLAESNHFVGHFIYPSVKDHTLRVVARPQPAPQADLLPVQAIPPLLCRRAKEARQAGPVNTRAAWIAASRARLARLESLAARLEARPEILDARREIVEHPFSSIKQWMYQGAFLMRGLEKVAGEFSLTALAYNLRRALNIVGMEKLMEAVRA